MRILNFLFFCILTSVSMHGQMTLKYAYDASGNRTKREIILTARSTPTADAEDYFTELVAERNIRIYPNPTYGQLKVEIDNAEGIENCIITISDMDTGKQVFINEATFPVTEIDISNQPPGVYIMLIDIDGKYTSWKIIKK